MTIKRIDLFGIPVAYMTIEQTVQLCLEWIKKKEQPHILVGLNVNNLILSKKDEAFAAALKTASLVQPDGVPIVWAARLLGTPIPERVNGTDLMERLIQEADRLKLRIFFLGATAAVVKRSVEIVSMDFPGLVIAGYQDGYFSKDQEREVIQQISNSHPDILFVGMPAPFRDVWCTQHLRELGVPVIHGVGGSLDVLSGNISRSPRWMQRCGLEWFWRLIMEPRRLWKRYLINNTIFIFLVFRELTKKFKTALPTY